MADTYLHILPLGLQHWLCLSWSSCGDLPCFWFAFNHLTYGLPRWRSGKKSACQCRRCERYRFSPWVGKLPWRRKWKPTPVFLPGQVYGQRSLVGFSPCSCKELGTVEWLRIYAWVSTVGKHVVCSSILRGGDFPRAGSLLSSRKHNLTIPTSKGITVCCESDVLMYQHSATCIVLEQKGICRTICEHRGQLWKLLPKGPLSWVLQ